MDNAMVQDLLDNFVMKNETNFDRVSNENPILYKAVVDALDFLSTRFGSNVQVPKKEESKILEILSFKVGDTFIDTNEPLKILRIKEIAEYFLFYESANEVLNITNKEAEDKFKSGRWVKVEPKSADDEIKIGDIFQDTIDDKFIVKVTGIEVNEYEFEKISDENFNFTFEKSMVEAKIKDGIWKRVTELEVFDILYPKKVTKTTSVTKTKKATLSKEIKELKEAIDGLEAVENFLEDDEKKELTELRKKLSDLQQKNS